MKSIRPGVTGGEERQRVLVIDDDRDMLELLFQTLDTEGFDTVVVADGGAAIKILAKVEPDIVILDTENPANDGVHVLDMVREHSSVPIIVLTQDAGMESLRQAIAHGADDYVRKPFGAKSFVARIRAKLRRV